VKKIVVGLCITIAAFIFFVSDSHAASAYGGVDYDLTGGVLLPMGGGDMGLTIGSDVMFWSPSRRSPLQAGMRFAFDYSGGAFFEFLPTFRWFLSSRYPRFFTQFGAGFYAGDASGVGLHLGGGAIFRNRLMIQPLFHFGAVDMIGLSLGYNF
jgi:hypothetical protein